MLHLQNESEEIINCFYTVYNTLGYGFLEKVYENSLIIELQSRGFNCRQQSPIQVYYESYNVGLYYADISVDDLFILELKSGAGGIKMAHELQLVNYLKATRFEIGYILHFGEKPEFKRRILTNDKK